MFQWFHFDITVSMAANVIQPNHRMDLMQAMYACSGNQNINKLNVRSLLLSFNSVHIFCSILNFSIKIVGHLPHERSHKINSVKFDCLLHTQRQIASLFHPRCVQWSNSHLEKSIRSPFCLREYIYGLLRLRSAVRRCLGDWNRISLAAMAMTAHCHPHRRLLAEPRSR